MLHHTLPLVSSHFQLIQFLLFALELSLKLFWLFRKLINLRFEPFFNLKLRLKLNFLCLQSFIQFFDLMFVTLLLFESSIELNLKVFIYVLE